MSKKEWGFLAIFLGAMSALDPLATDMYLPSLPLLTDEFSVSASLVQLSLTMFIAGMSIGQIMAGPFSDIYGRKLPVIGGMAAFMLASLACAMAENIYVFLTARFMQGFAGAFGVVVARAIASDLCEGPVLTKMFSILMLIGSLSPVLSPTIGGQMMLYASWRGTFILLGILSLLVGVAGLFFKESLPVHMRQKTIGKSLYSFKQLLSEKYFLGHCLIQCAYFAAFYAYISGSSFLFQNIYQVSAQTYSLIFGAVGLCLALAGFIPARLAGRVADVSLVAWGLVQGLIGAVLLAMTVLFHAPLLSVIMALIIMVPSASIFATASFSLGMRARGRMAGSAAALIGFFSMISGSFVAPMVGICGPENPLPMAVICVSGMAVALLLFSLMVWPTHCMGGNLIKQMQTK